MHKNILLCILFIIYIVIAWCIEFSVFKDHVADYKSPDPRIDQEIIDSIDQAYFKDDQTFDIVEYDLTVSGLLMWAYVILFVIDSKLWSILIFAYKWLSCLMWNNVFSFAFIWLWC